MEIKKLAALLKVIDLGDLEQALPLLHCSKSQLMLDMDQLEQEKGIHIFNRDGNKIELTPAGRQLEPLIRAMVDSEARLAETIHDFSCQGHCEEACPVYRDTSPGEAP